MNNTVIGYLDGYLVKEAEEPSYVPGSSLWAKPGQHEKFQGLFGDRSLEEKGQWHDLIYARASVGLQEDWLYKVTASDTSRRLGAAGVGGGIFALMGGLMGGTKGAVVGGLLGTLIGFVAEAMGIIPAEAWEKLAEWRANDAVDDELGNLVKVHEDNGGVTPDKVKAALNAPESAKTLAIMQDQTNTWNSIPVEQRTDEVNRKLSDLKAKMAVVQEQVVVEGAEQQAQDLVNAIEDASPVGKTEFDKAQIHTGLAAATDVNARAQLNLQKTLNSNPSPENLDRARDRAFLAKRDLEENVQAYNDKGTSYVGFKTPGELLPQLNPVGVHEKMEDAARNAPTLEALRGLPGAFHAKLNQTTKSRTGSTYDNRPGYLARTKQRILNPFNVMGGEAIDANTPGPWWGPLAQNFGFANYKPQDWEGYDEKDPDSQMKIYEYGAEHGNRPAIDELARLRALEAPPTSPTPPKLPSKVMTRDNKGVWTLNSPPPTKEEKTLFTQRRNEKMKKESSFWQPQGSSRFIGMPWRDAQKLAAPVQQAAPMDPVPQAPSEKDIFDHKAKMEEMQMQQQLIGAKAQASHAASAQVTQTSKAKAQEAAQSMGQGDQSTGGQPQTAMAGSMSQNHPQTQPQSTPDQPGTPMPEAQWTAPTTV